ncbi:MAG: hypothetical protein ABI999_16315 [Acidobacteriota bacterium]
MRTDLSNEVIARIDDEATQMPRRTLDLQKIVTPELGLLSPQRSEIAPRGRGRDAALIAYSERLRESYKTNEGGIRDGMLKLGEAYRNGHMIAVTCFCRAGEICHADVVKMAIEKVGSSLVRQAERQKTQESTQQTLRSIRPNPRTERAVNEILSVSKADLILSKLEDTEVRNRSEHASHLNGYSQFVRDLYERGAVVRDGVLISPKENPSLSAPLAVTTIAYAIKRLEPIVEESRAKELAPQLVEYANKIAGASADRDSKVKVFNWIYGALEGRSDLLKSDDRVPATEAKEERFERTLKEIAGLAEEMGRLEPSDRFVAIESLNEHEEIGAERAYDDLSLENVYEEAPLREEHAPADSEHTLGGIQEFERVELEDTSLSRFAADMSKEELDRWVDVRLPVLDELLEEGTPVDAILKPFQNDIYQAAKEEPAAKQAAIDDLKFASRYIEHQLKQPESRLRHFNSRYRNYAEMLEIAASREGLMDAASRIRLENAKLGFQWEKLTEREKDDLPRPLTSKEMQYLFTEASPRHYTREMTATRLAYSIAGEAARTKTDALMRGEIAPSKEARQLIESLDSRLERRRSADSLSATRHFLQSLKTPNEELRFKNPFDHAELYRKLPPAERDFVYQRAVLQKESLEAKVFGARSDQPLGKQLVPVEGISAETGNALRADLKAEIVGVLKGGFEVGDKELIERTRITLEKNLGSLVHEPNGGESLQDLSQKFANNISGRISGDLIHSPHSERSQRASMVKDSVRESLPIRNIPAR